MKPNLNILFISLSLLLGIGKILGQSENDQLPKIQHSGNNDYSLLETVVNRLNRLETDFQENITDLKHQLGLALQEISQLKGEKINNNNGHHHKSAKASIPRTCYEIKSSQPAYTQGTYIIDPSGLGKDPITVYCDADGKTLISHDSEETSSISSCLGADCFTRIVTYEAKLQQMRSLTSISSECRQSFRYECTMAPFEYNGVQYSYWKDAFGNVKDYWAGPKSDSHTCQCGIERNCLNVGNTCNCDSLSSSLQVDNGFITDKEALPVSELHFGRTQLSGSSGRYTLGKLECSERSTFEGFPSGCRDLHQIGHVLNGFYPVSSDVPVNEISNDFVR